MAVKVHAAGFEPQCGTHRLWLLPVVDFSWSFQCEKCREVANLGWGFQIAGMNVEQIGKYCAGLLTEVVGQEFEYAGTVPDGPPSSFMQEMADRLDRLGLTWPWMCSGECGCRLFTDDADKRECGCDGECTGGDAAGTQDGNRGEAV